MTLPIEPDFNQDHTLEWADRIGPGVSASAYQRYSPPATRAICIEQIDALSDTITSVTANFLARKREATQLSAQGYECSEAESAIRRSKDAKRRFEAARSAYLHWLRVEDGGVVSIETLGTVSEQQIKALAIAVRMLAETYSADLAEQIEIPEAQASVSRVLELLDSIE